MFAEAKNDPNRRTTKTSFFPIDLVARWTSRSGILIVLRSRLIN